MLVCMPSAIPVVAFRRIVGATNLSRTSQVYWEDTWCNYSPHAGRLCQAHGLVETMATPTRSSVFCNRRPCVLFVLITIVPIASKHSESNAQSATRIRRMGPRAEAPFQKYVHFRSMCKRRSGTRTVSCTKIGHVAKPCLPGRGQAMEGDISGTPR